MIKKIFISILIFFFVLSPISYPEMLDFSWVINAQDNLEGDNWYENGIISENIFIEKEETITIKEGVTLNFTNKYSGITVAGELIIKGTKENPVIVKSDHLSGESFSIATEPGSKLDIKNTQIIGGGTKVFLVKNLTNRALAGNYSGAIQVEGGNVNIEDTTFKNNRYAVLSKNNLSGNLKVNYSKFIDNEFDVEDENYSDFKHNWWGSSEGVTETCIEIPPYGLRCSKDKSYGNFIYEPWQTEENFTHNEGASSVLFLPGMQSSRLYKKHSFDEDKMWEPTNRNEDVKDLYLNEDGTSIDDKIYTKDIIDEIYYQNIYKKFISSMDKLVEDNAIQDWESIPYDWRLPLESAIDDGIRLENGNLLDIMEETIKLAEDSNTGKVTIIGHSNGGLLAKVLIDRLENIGKEDLIDRLIMVATPQVGTPKAIAGLLHGDEINIPLLLDKSTARGLAENMSSAYNLLPSRKYFDYVQTPVIEFDEDVKEIYDFRDIYGSKIGSYGELKKFLLGDDGRRDDPDFSDTDSPNVLSEDLLNDANDIHSNFLDGWRVPEDIEIIQIAGWGLDTVSGIKYDDCDTVFCPDKLSNLDRKLIFKEDGDGTVVIPSAIIMNDGEIYYVNIKDYNRGINKNREHCNILEIAPLQEFIKNILNEKRNLPIYITTTKPTLNDEDENLRYRMHSPVAVHLYDENGSHTGIIDNTNPDSDLVYYEEEISNSYYVEFGETKYLGSSKEDGIRVELTGEDEGIFTFEIDEIEGENIIKTTIFKDIPVLEGLKASIDISENIGIMELDFDGDGKIDAEIDVDNDSNELVSLEILKEIINSSSINKILKKHFIRKILIAERFIERDRKELAGKMLEILERQIKVFSNKNMIKKFRISQDEADDLIRIIETIRLNLIK